MGAYQKTRGSFVLVKQEKLLKPGGQRGQAELYGHMNDKLYSFQQIHHFEYCNNHHHLKLKKNVLFYHYYHTDRKRDHFNLTLLE